MIATPYKMMTRYTMCFLKIFFVFNFFSGLVLCSGSGHDHVLSDSVHNILQSVQGFIGKIQDFVGDKSGCSFTCSDGLEPVPNLNHQPSSNGCGAFGIKFGSEISLKTVTKCCDEHDYCYDTCNNKKLDCDRAFKECLQSVCKKAKKILLASDDFYDGCKSTADLMYAGTVALGCKPYKDAQQNACFCKTRKSNYKYKHEF